MDPYDLISVDWNPEQTAVWLASVKRNCPAANVILVPDTKPIPECWSSGKLGFKDATFENPRRVVYMDTDTLCLGPDVGGIFERMPAGAFIGVTRYTTWWACTERSEAGFINAGGPAKKAAVYRAFGLEEGTPYRHFSSGMLVLKDHDPRSFFQMWFDASIRLKEAGFPVGFTLFEEVALSLLLTQLDNGVVFHLPKQVHNNILNSTPPTEYDAKHKFPWVLHYHKRSRIQKHHALLGETRRFFECQTLI